jgi:hypothetical protein
VKLHKIVTPRLAVTTTDMAANPPVPPNRLVPSVLENRALEELTTHADIHSLLAEANNSTVMAVNAKAAAEAALLTLSERFNQTWSNVNGSTVSIEQGQPVYRTLPDGTHVTIGFLMETKPDGTRSPVSVDINEGSDIYRCYVHVSLNAIAV